MIWIIKGYLYVFDYQLFIIIKNDVDKLGFHKSMSE